MPTALLPSLPLCQPSRSPGTPCTAPGDRDLARPPRSPAPAPSPPQGHSAPRLLPGRRLARVWGEPGAEPRLPGPVCSSFRRGLAVQLQLWEEMPWREDTASACPASVVAFPARTTPYWLPSPLLPSLTEVWPRGRPWASTVRERLCPTSASPPPPTPTPSSSAENTALLSV